MKKFLLIIMSLTLILTACDSGKKEEEEYLIKANDLYLEITSIGITATLHAKTIADLWHEAIFGDKFDDFDKTIRAWMDTDLYKEDMADIEPRGREATKEIKALADYPEGYERVYNALNELNEIVRDATDLVASPSGNYRSYTSTVSNTSDEFLKKIEDIRIELELKAEELDIELRKPGEEFSDESSEE